MQEKNNIFSLTLTKLVGLYQILDPDTCKIYGFNAYHIGIFAFSLYLLVSSILDLIGLYYWINDRMAFASHLGFLNNYLSALYKAAHIAYCSNDLWRLLRVSRFDSFSCGRYSREIFEKWQKFCTRMTYTYVITSFFCMIIWILVPTMFNDTMITIKNRDGSLSEYRMNIINQYILVQDETYNEYYNVFYCIETGMLISFLYLSMIYDYLVIIIFFTLSYQLETICDAVQNLGYRRSTDDISTYIWYQYNVTITRYNFTLRIKVLKLPPREFLCSVLRTWIRETEYF